MRGLTDLFPWNQRALLWQFAKRDVLARYRGSMLGLAWSFLTPLLMIAAGHGSDFRLSVAARLGLPDGTPMLYLETLHLAGGQPFVLETRWLNPAVLPSPAPDFARVSANEWLVTHVSLVSGDIAFTAEPATPREAEVMGVAPWACFSALASVTFQ